MNRRIGAITAALLVMVVTAARAEHPGEGRWMLWLGINGNRAQLVGPTTSPINTFENPEYGVHAAAGYFLSDEWTLQLAGGYDVGRSRFEPSSPGAPAETFTSSSYNLRLGTDRFAFLNDQIAIYAGPGILYWSGVGKYAGSTVSGINGDWPTVSQIALSGRFGMWARLSGSWGMFGHIGEVIGNDQASDSNGKNNWWTTHTEGSFGLSFDL